MYILINMMNTTPATATPSPFDAGKAAARRAVAAIRRLPDPQAALHQAIADAASATGDAWDRGYLAGLRAAEAEVRS